MLDITVSRLWAGYIWKQTEAFRKPTQLQAIIVLMGDFTEDYTGLGDETLRRMQYTLSIDKLFQVEKIVCIGGSRPNENIFGAELMGAYLMENGIPQKKVHTDGNSYDTRSNWEDALRLVKEHKWREVGVISSAFHLYRLEKSIVNTDNSTQIFFLPYPYSQSQPETTPFDLWIAIHYEWITFILYSMPEPIYDLVLTFLRPQIRH